MLMHLLRNNDNVLVNGKRFWFNNQRDMADLQDIVADHAKQEVDFLIEELGDELFKDSRYE